MGCLLPTSPSLPVTTQHPAIISADTSRNIIISALSVLPENINMMVKMIQIQLIFADIYIYLQPGREEGGVCTAQSSVYSVHSSRQSVCTLYRDLSRLILFVYLSNSSCSNGMPWQGSFCYTIYFPIFGKI